MNRYGLYAPDRLSKLSWPPEGSHHFTILYNLRQYFTNDYWCFLLQGRYEGNKYEGYYYPRVGETREKFTCNTNVDSSHNVNGTRLEVPPESTEMIGRMLYDNYRMTYPKYQEKSQESSENTQTIAAEEEV